MIHRKDLGKNIIEHRSPKNVKEWEAFKVPSLFSAAVAQAFHDDRVVELKEQLVVKEVDGEDRKEKFWKKGEIEQRERAMDMTVDDKVFAQDLSQ